MRRYCPASFVSAAVAATLLCACTSVSTGAAATATTVGSDRDAHGCIGSAGYAWCEATQRCERPWELAKLKGFAASQEGFVRYCSGTAAQ
nr:hypothetical protein [Paraburkholderia unamae]